MILFRLTALSIVLSVATTSFSADKPVHVFILSGQSNMAGMNPKIGFESEAKKLFPEAEVVYFKVARGGQPIRLWVSQWNEIAVKHNLTTKISAKDGKGDGTLYYQPILAEYKKLIAEHPNPASVTFCLVMMREWF